ncbi:hypothetical protein [Rhodovastum atsumiense]|uniref:hypothetical protein n=1 Tax=Rhodovastum atsumiense TaxID=504468 RepID=UPI002024131B|nr:hypothetical protein [Rhodovastum atsumiense]
MDAVGQRAHRAVEGNDRPDDATDDEGKGATHHEQDEAANADDGPGPLAHLGIRAGCRQMQFQDPDLLGFSTAFGPLDRHAPDDQAIPVSGIRAVAHEDPAILIEQDGPRVIRVLAERRQQGPCGIRVQVPQRVARATGQERGGETHAIFQGIAAVQGGHINRPEHRHDNGRGQQRAYRCHRPDHQASGQNGRHGGLRRRPPNLGRKS